MKKLLSILCIASMAILFTSCDKPTVSNDGQTTITQMGWGSAYHYANISTTNQGLLTVLGIIAIVAASGFAFMVWVKKKDWLVSYQKAIVFALLVTAVCLFLIAPNKVRMDNCYPVPTQYFKDSGQTHILDSLYENNLMQGAPYK